MLGLALASITAGQAQLILTGNNASLEYPGNGTAIPPNVADANGWYYVNGAGQNGFASPQVGYVKRQGCAGQPVNATYSFASNVNYPGNCSSTAQHGEAHDLFGGVPPGCIGHDKYIMLRGQGTNAASESIGVVHTLDVPVTAGQIVVFRGWVGYKRGIPATLGTTNFQVYMALGNTTDPPVTFPTPAANTVGLLSGTIPTNNCMTWVHPIAGFVAPQNFNRIIFYVRTSAPVGARNHFYLDDLSIATVTPMVQEGDEAKETLLLDTRAANVEDAVFPMEKLLAWPVPAQNEVHIAMPWNDELSSGRITLHDAAGREVYTASTHGNQHTIPLNALPPGIYSALYMDPNRVALVRVQKE